MKVIKYLFEALFIYTFFFIIKVIGLNNGRKLATLIFKNIGPFFKSKNIINENLDRALIDNSNSTKKEIILKMWSNYAMTFVEYLYLKRFKKNILNNSKITIKGKNIIDQIKIEKKPVIFISGHFANFELMSMEITKRNIPLATIYRPLNNIFLNPLMEFLRKKYVCNNQIKKGINGVRESIEYLRKGCSIALMIDQRVSEGIPSPFFNKEALTTTIPAQFVKKFDCRVVPIYIDRVLDTNFKINIFEPIKFEKDESVEIITSKLNLCLENMISKNPSKWIWSHNRWK